MKPALCSLLLLLLAVCVGAQSITSNIVGTIKGADGAVIPNVAVTITNKQTNLQYNVTTDGEGYYKSPPLPVGLYQVEAKMNGFKTAVRSDISLRISQTAVIDITLEVGALADQVTVTAEAPALETTTAALGKVVDNRRIADLPLNTRNVYSLIFLTPGVTGSVGNSYGDMNYSINGARVRSMDTLVDGVSASFPTVNGGAGISVFPSVDAIQEYKVLGSTFSAEYGRSQGSIINLIYKGGTNALHGSAYEFLRNSYFDANNWFDNRRGQKLGSFKRSQFGGHVAGPILRDKLFFMGSYEGLRARSFATRVTTVPTLLQRQGDFSQTFNQSNALIRVFNPFSTRANPAGGFIRDQFTGNKIPTNMMDPVALNVMKYMPLPNQPGDALTGANNYAASGSAQLNLDNYDGRLDWRPNERQSFSARYSFRYTEDVPLVAFPKEITIAEGRVIQENIAHNAVIEYTHTFSPTLILVARSGFARTLFVFSNQGLGFKPSSLGFKPPTQGTLTIDTTVDREMFPAFSFSGYTGLGGNDHRYNAFMSYPTVVSVTKNFSRHNLKMGGEVRPIRVNVWEARNAGSFSFTAGMTQGPNPNTASSSAGNGFASFLLGTGSSGLVIQGWKNVASQSFYYAGYVQDDWRVSRKLTLNLGVRYDLDTPRTERYNRMNYFDPNAVSPLASQVSAFPNLKGGVVFAGANGNSRYQYKVDNNNIGPRLGLAYQLDQKTVIRAGYSNLYGPSPQAAQGTVGPFGYRLEYPWVNSLDGITPFNLLSNPYPAGFRQLPGSADGLLTQVGAGLQAPLQDTVVPWSQQWNLNIQRELPWKMSMEIAYVGTRGLQLARNTEGGLTLNQLDPKHMALGSQLNQLVDNPFFGKINNGTALSQQRISRGQLLRPFPQFTDIIPLFSSGASSIYHGLQVTFSKRMSNGLLVEGNYTWAKNIEEGQSHQDSYNIRSSRSLADIDLAHRFVASYLYEFPFGRGQKWGGNAHWLTNMLIGGWQFNGITTYQTGTPLSISASNTAGVFSQAIRANNNGKSGKLEGPAKERLNRYFDTTVFSQPAAFTFGNLTPTLPDIRNDSLLNSDLSLFKVFTPVEKLKVQFRVEAINAFNKARFGSPNTSVTSTTFGQITTQANAPRQMQFALKLLW